MSQVKICGVTTAPARDAALDGGATHLGFVLFAASPRSIGAQAAAALAAPARGRAAIVAVMVDPDDDALDDMVRGLQPDFVQLHGRESPARVRDVAARTGTGVIKAVAVADAADIAAARAFETVADHLMFDAKAPPGASRPGGVGARFDTALLEGARWSRPWFLAGGLDPWNVAEAIRLSGAPAVDVSSGVERGAGLKDPALITAFLKAARAA